MTCPVQLFQMTGTTWCSISRRLQSTFYVSGTTVQSLSNYHIAQKWLWHSGTMALSEWLGGSSLGQRWAGIMKSRWFPVYRLGERTENRKTSYKGTEHSTPGSPDPGVRKTGKKPKTVAGEIGAGRRHGAIHFISREIPTSPPPFISSRLETCTRSRPWMAQVVLIYWIQIFGAFFPTPHK